MAVEIRVVHENWRVFGRHISEKQEFLSTYPGGLHMQILKDEQKELLCEALVEYSNEMGRRAANCENTVADKQQYIECCEKAEELMIQIGQAENVVLDQSIGACVVIEDGNGQPLSLSITWTADDVLAARPDMNECEVASVLEELKLSYSAEEGITWEKLQDAAEKIRAVEFHDDWWMAAHLESKGISIPDESIGSKAYIKALIDAAENEGFTHYWREFGQENVFICTAQAKLDYEYLVDWISARQEDFDLDNRDVSDFFDNSSLRKCINETVDFSDYGEGSEFEAAQALIACAKKYWHGE